MDMRKVAVIPASVVAAATAFAACGALLQPTSAHDAHRHFAAGEPGHPKGKSRTIAVTMNESDGKMLFSPNRIEVRQGEQIRFVLTNAGYLDHEFVVGTQEENARHAELMKNHADMKHGNTHDDPNGKTVKPKQKAELIWRFSKPGTFEFACLIPGHYEAGMYGTIVVK